MSGSNQIKMSQRVQINDAQDVVVINGVRFSAPALRFITSTSDPDLWFRFERRRDVMVVHSRTKIGDSW